MRVELLPEFAEALADTPGGAVPRQEDGSPGDLGRLCVPRIASVAVSSEVAMSVARP